MTLAAFLAAAFACAISIALVRLVFPSPSWKASWAIVLRSGGISLLVVVGAGLLLLVFLGLSSGVSLQAVRALHASFREFGQRNWWTSIVSGFLMAAVPEELFKAYVFHRTRSRPVTNGRSPDWIACGLLVGFGFAFVENLDGHGYAGFRLAEAAFRRTWAHAICTGLVADGAARAVGMKDRRAEVVAIAIAIAIHGAYDALAFERHLGWALAYSAILVRIDLLALARGCQPNGFWSGCQRSRSGARRSRT